MMRNLGFIDAKKILRKYKLPFPSSELAKSESEVCKIADKMRYPVVLKIDSPDIIHKSDVGGVIVDLKSKEEIETAYCKIIKNIKNAKINGVVVQKMERGTAVIIGMKRDAQFGPVLMFGLGGIFVEIMKDVSFRIAPIDKNEAMEMIKEIKGYEVLKGARGSEKANINAIADIILKLSKLAIKEKNIVELDFNPVIVNKKTAKIVDARFIAGK
ncbi:MAG: acetate--CoA ligase family protein [Candidatus Woesearchaeota archaeon]|nr:acetate--CoA ligase family protein [Candidatus Woesearchaeota archaeon]